MINSENNKLVIFIFFLFFSFTEKGPDIQCETISIKYQVFFPQKKKEK